jgi:lycopene cyclase domain-containing protein
MRGEYLILLAAILLVPLALSFDRNIRLYQHAGSLLKALLVVSGPFWIWDLVVTARGHWTFNEQYVLGITLLGMPVEEWLFFPVVAFVSIFTWESVKYFVRRNR